MANLERLKREVDPDDHGDATSLRLLPQSATFRAFDPLDTDELSAGALLLVSEVPLIWGVGMNDGEPWPDPIHEDHEVSEYDEFFAFIPDGNGKRVAWVTLTQAEVRETRKAWRL